MPKNLFEDMVRIKRERRASLSVDRVEPTNTLNTQKIINPPKPKFKEEKTDESSDYSTDSKFASVYDVAFGGENKKGTKHTMWFVAGISVLVLLFALSYLFAAASVSINPKSKSVVLNESISATKDATNEESISFDLVVLSGEETKSIKGGEEKEVLRRAKGIVIIYNEFGAAPQNLDIDTRLEGSNGKIYKTVAKTVVPGKGKDGKPGSVEVGIYANEPGEAYNSTPLDFKIFGFKNGPKYTKFYARSKDKITGGATGKERVVSVEEKAATISELEKTLQTKLFKKATDQIPSGFILFKDASFFQAEEVVDDSKTVTATKPEALVPITLKGTIYGVLFDEQKLTKMLALDLIAEYKGEEVYIPNIDKLTFVLADADVSVKDAKTLDFKLIGNTTIVWKVDTDKFKEDILGKPKKDFEKILASYPNIRNARVTIRPVWKMSFPNNSKDITILVNELK